MKLRLPILLLSAVLAIFSSPKAISDTLNWNAESGTWSTTAQDPSPWTDGKNFNDGDSVEFKNIADKTAATVTVNGTVNPANITIDTSSTKYTMKGTSSDGYSGGFITGSTGIVKKGSNQFVMQLLEGLSFTGDVVVEEGEFKWGNGSGGASTARTCSLGTGNIVVKSGAGFLFHFNNQKSGSYPVVSVTNNMVIEDGGRFKVDDGSVTLAGNLTIQGTATALGGWSGRQFQLSGELIGGDGAVWNIEGATENYNRETRYFLSKAGGNSFSGTINVKGGNNQYPDTALIIEDNLSVQHATVDLQGATGKGAAILRIADGVASPVLANIKGTLNSRIEYSGAASTLAINNSIENNFEGAITGDGLSLVKNNGGTLSLGKVAIGGTIAINDGTVIFKGAGVNALKDISGAGNVEFSGGSSFTLTGSNTYTGSTTIGTGNSLTIDYATAGTGFASPSMSLNGGTLNLTGGSTAASMGLTSFTLGSGASIITLNSSAALDLDLGQFTLDNASQLTINLVGDQTSIKANSGLTIDVSNITVISDGGYGKAKYDQATGLITLDAATTLANLQADGNSPDTDYQLVNEITMAADQTINSLKAGKSTGVTLDLNGTNLTVTDSVTWTIGDNTVTGNGKLVANNMELATGSMTQDADIEVGGNGGSLTTNRDTAWTINSGKNLNVQGTGAHVLNGMLNISGSLILNNEAALTVSEGSIDINTGGRISLEAGSKINGGTTTLKTGGLITFADAASLEGFTLNAQGGTLQWATGSTANISSSMKSFTGSSLILDTQDNYVNFSNAFTLATPAMTYTKIGSGTLKFSERVTSNNNTKWYIKEGAIELGKESSQPTIQGTLTVQNGGTLVFSAGDVLGYNKDNKLSIIVEEGGLIRSNTTKDVTFQDLTLTLSGGRVSGNGYWGMYSKDGSATIKTTVSPTGGQSVIDDVTIAIRSEANKKFIFDIARDTGKDVNYADLLINSKIEQYNKSGVNSGTIHKLGDGTVAFANNNSFAQDMVIEAGAVMVGYGINGSETGTLGVPGRVNSDGSVTKNAEVTINSGAKLIFNRSNTYSVVNLIKGDGEVEKRGTGVTVFSNDNSYGATTIKAGTLMVGNGGTTGSLGTGNVANDSTLIFNRSDSVTINNIISGSGNVIFQGGGTYKLAGANTYSGSTAVTEGSTLHLDYSGGSPALSAATSLTLSKGTLTLTGGTSAQTLTLSGLTLTGGTQSGIIMTGNGGALTLNVGAISDTGSMLITQQGSGTLELYTTAGATVETTRYTFFDGTDYYTSQYNSASGLISKTSVKLNELQETGNSPGENYISTITLRELKEDATIAGLFVSPVAGGATLDLGGHKLTITDNLNYSAGESYTVTGTGNLTVNSLIMNNAGKTLIQDADISVGSNGGAMAAASGTWQINAGKTLTLGGSGSHVMGVGLTGGGTVNLANTASLTLAGDNTSFEGLINLNKDTTLVFSNIGNLGKLGDSKDNTSKIALLGGTLKWAEGSTANIMPFLQYGIQDGGTAVILDTNSNNVTLSHSAEVGLPTPLDITKTGEGDLAIGSKINTAVNMVIEEGTLTLKSGGGSGGIRGSVTVKDGTKLVFATADSTGYWSGQNLSTINVEKGGIVESTVSGNQSWIKTTLNMTGGRITGMGDLDILEGLVFNILASDVSSLIDINRVELRQADKDFIINVERYGGAADDYSDLIIASNIVSNGIIIKNGAGTMTLTGTNTMGGTFNLNEGSLMVGNNGTTGTLGSMAVNINSGASLIFNRSDDTTITNTLSGSGSIVHKNNNTLTLGGDNSGFAGSITVNDGTLKADSDSAFGTSAITLKKGLVDLSGKNDASTITIFEGNLANAGAKTSGTVNIQQSSIANVDLGGLNGNRLGSISLAMPGSGVDAVSRITGITGDVTIASDTRLGLSSNMVADAPGGTGDAVLEFNGNGSLSLSNLTLVLTDDAATMIMDAAGIKAQYLHLANVQTSISGTLSYDTPYHYISDHFEYVSTTGNNGWIKINITGDTGRLYVSSDRTYEVNGYSMPGFDKFTGITNNGTINLNLGAAPSPTDGLKLIDLEGSSSAAVINTGSNAGARIILQGDGTHASSLYQGSITGNAQIVKNMAGYDLTVNGQLSSSKLDVNAGSLILGGRVNVAGATTVVSGAGLVLNGTGSSISALQVDGSLSMADSSSLSVNTLEMNGTLALGNGAHLTVNNALNGNGSITMNHSTILLNNANVLDTAMTGNGVLDIQGGTLSFGSTGSVSDGMIINLGDGGSFSIEGASDAKNIIGGLTGTGSLMLNDATLQIKGQGTNFEGSFVQNGTGPSTIDYSGAGTQTYTGTGAGFVNITQSGSGKTVLSNSSPMTYGNVAVTQGSLELNNDLISSSMSVGNGSSLVLGKKNGGEVSSTIHTVDLSMSAGSNATVYFNTSALTSGVTFITATGAVSQPTGGQFTFDLQASGTQSDWTEMYYTLNLVQGTGMFDSNAYLFKLNELLTNLGYSISSIDYSSGIKVQLESSGQNGLTQYANSNNTEQAANALWSARRTIEKNGTLDQVITSLMGSGASSQEITNTLASFAGSSVTALMGATRDDLFQQVRSIRNRTTQMGLAEGYSYKDELPYFNAWIQGNGGWNRLDQDGDKAGYTLDTWGGTVGFDVNVSQPLTLGAAFTANHSKLKTKSYDYATGDMDAYYANLFARLQIKNWAHVLVLTGTWNDMNLDRTINVAGLGNLQSNGDTSGTTFGAFYEGTYDVKLNRDKTAVFQPLANASIYRTNLDGYTEEGAGDASMRINSLNATYGRAGLGGRVLGVIGSNLLGREAFGEVRAQVSQDYGDRADVATLSPVGAPGSSMRVHGAKVGRTGVQVGAGIALPVGNQGTVYMDIDADFRTKATSFGGNLGYRYNF